ncbi:MULTISPECIES: ferredoxin [unclassified Streptomyces]|uniref:ferredoxin n=1 Tax=unclassified Streptomyces TaxID=2593676 RepID=UPI00378F48DD
MRPHITADAERCYGAGLCVLTAPEVFDQREEDGVVVLLDPHPAARLYDAVEEASRLCPAGAIGLTAEATR